VRIGKLVVDQAPRIAVQYANFHTKGFSPTPPLTRTNSVLRNELLPYYYATKSDGTLAAKYLPTNAQDWGSWLGNVDSEMLHHVKGLKLQVESDDLKYLWNLEKDFDRTWRRGNDRLPRALGDDGPSRIFASYLRRRWLVQFELVSGVSMVSFLNGEGRFKTRYVQEIAFAP
jgi:hypothetical protein